MMPRWRPHLPIDAVVCVVIHLPDDQRRLILLDLMPQKLQLLHELIHIDLAIALLVHAFKGTAQALELLSLLKLSPLTLTPLLLGVRLGMRASVGEPDAAQTH